MKSYETRRMILKDTFFEGDQHGLFDGDISALARRETKHGNPLS
jgi:hypothetical protein